MIKTSMFQVFEDLEVPWTLRHKTKAKKKKRAEDEKCASPSTLDDMPYSRVLPSVTIREP